MKYRWTHESQCLGSVSGDWPLTVRRIQACVEGPWGPPGTLGGWLEHSHNLSQEDLCWVSDDAVVIGQAQVLDQAWVGDRARIADAATVRGQARVEDDATLFEHSVVEDRASVRQCASLRDRANIGDDAVIQGTSTVCHRARVGGVALVQDHAMVGGATILSGAAQILDQARVEGSLFIGGATIIGGGAVVTGALHFSGHPRILGQARLHHSRDWCSITPLGSRHDCLTAYRTRTGWELTTGCFRGTREEFLMRVQTVHAGTRYLPSYLAALTFFDAFFASSAPSRSLSRRALRVCPRSRAY